MTQKRKGKKRLSERQKKKQVVGKLSEEVASRFRGGGYNDPWILARE